MSNTEQHNGSCLLDLSFLEFILIHAINNCKTSLVVLVLITLSQTFSISMIILIIDFFLSFSFSAVKSQL